MTERLSPAATAVLKAADAGLYDLPNTLAPLRAARDRLGGELNRPAPNLGAAHRAYSEAVLDAAMAGADLPEPLDVLDELTRLDAHNTRSKTLREVHEHLTRELSTAVDDLGEELIVGTLRPPWTAAYTSAVDAVRVFLPHGDNKAALFSAPAPARAAYLKFGEHVATMTALTTIVDSLRLSGGNRPQLDEFDLTRSVRDVNAAWPEVQGNRLPTSALSKLRPWPADPGERVVWSVRTGHELWFPTPHEQDQAYRELFAERMADHAEQTMRHAGARAWATS